MIESLYCEAGHQWTREAKRGVKPKRCPEHRGVLHPDTQDDQPEEAKSAEETPLAKAHRAKAAAKAARDQSIAQQAQAVLDDPNVNPELKRKLGYCQTQLARGGREPGDIALLAKRREDLIQESQRGAMVAA